MASEHYNKFRHMTVPQAIITGMKAAVDDDEDKMAAALQTIADSLRRIKETLARMHGKTIQEEDVNIQICNQQLGTDEEDTVIKFQNVTIILPRDCRDDKKHKRYLKFIA